MRYGAKRPLNGVAVAYFATTTYPQSTRETHQYRRAKTREHRAIFPEHRRNSAEHRRKAIKTKPKTNNP